MADNVAIKDGGGSSVNAATDELADNSQSPKITLLRGDASVAAISPATAYAEDSVAVSGDYGTMALSVRRDTAAASAANGDYATLNTDATGRLYTAGADGGDVAHDAADSGNPVKAGGQARTTNPTAVADADRANFITDKLGKQVVVNSIRDLKGVQKTTITSSTGETTIITAVASTFLDLYGLIVANTSATATSVTIKDSSSGTTRVILRCPAGDTRGFMLTESAAIPQATVNNNWTATCADSVASIEITALYVKNI